MESIASHLGLGTAQFGTIYGVNNQGKMVSDADLRRILCQARDLGMRTIDTAVAYGQAEQRLGGYDLKPFDVITKITAPETLKDLSKFKPEEMIRASLDRLGIDCLDAVLVHNADQMPLDVLPDVMAKLDILVEKGLCRRTGLSLYDPQKLCVFIPKYQPGVIQVPFNVFDQRLADDNVQKLCQKHDVEIHARSIFLQGLLLMEQTSTPNYFLPWRDNFALWYDRLNKFGLAPVEGVMSFVNQHKGKTASRFIIGAETPKQLEMIIAAIETPAILSTDDLRCDDLGLINPTRWTLS